MRRSVICWLIGLGVVLGAVRAESAPSETLMGAWAVDTSRLPMPPAARPRSVTLTFAQADAQQLRLRVEVVDPAGARLEAEGVTPLDGTPTAVKANFEADMSATTMPRPEVLIMQLAKNGAPASTRIYTVEPGGQTMVETVAHFTADGRPVVRKNYFSRLP
ncbi:hypothetical protein [Inhella gelatinilytica]|uniref:LuxR family transcriptional regulator n=1 Tax=Inhella gelatinilytica TaxID=2795030 RepID=A0A931IYR9_9BURK|nr:hypothetical protein [Inhella gelatinilytica]MBH9553063.1 hypothetical protein [Inhella gelatinilytica]